MSTQRRAWNERKFHAAMLFLVIFASLSGIGLLEISDRLYGGVCTLVEATSVRTLETDAGFSTEAEQDACFDRYGSQDNMMLTSRHRHKHTSRSRYRKQSTKSSNNEFTVKGMLDLLIFFALVESLILICFSEEHQEPEKKEK